MKKITYTPTENSSTSVHGNQQNIYDINTQRKELDKGMLSEHSYLFKLSIMIIVGAQWRASL